MLQDLRSRFRRASLLQLLLKSVSRYRRSGKNHRENHLAGQSNSNGQWCFAESKSTDTWKRPSKGRSINTSPELMGTQDIGQERCHQELHPYLDPDKTKIEKILPFWPTSITRIADKLGCRKQKTLIPTTGFLNRDIKYKFWIEI